MVTILISFFMFVLLVVSGLMSVIILMQKPSANAGMGAALGGGAAESVFGGEASGQLLKFTVRIAVAFFLLSFLLFMAIVAAERPATKDLSLPAMPGGALPATPASTSKPATTAADATKAAAPAASATPAPAPKAASSAASTSSK